MAKDISKSSGLADAVVPRTSTITTSQKKNRSKNSKAKNPRGFRLTEKDRDNLSDITEGVAELTSTRITDTHVIRALIQLGKDIEPEVILGKIREIIV